MTSILCDILKEKTLRAFERIESILTITFSLFILLNLSLVLLTILTLNYQTLLILLMKILIGKEDVQ